MTYKVDALHAVGLGRESERFADDGRAREVLFGERTIGLEDQADGFAQVLARFLQGSALGVGARELLDEGDKAFRDLTIDGGEFDGHGAPDVSGP